MDGNLNYIYMKKAYPTLIALFLMGGMCQAAVLHSGESLRNQQAVTMPGSKMAKAPAKAGIEASDATHFQITVSPYDMYGQFAYGSQNYGGHGLLVVMPADGASGEVAITGLHNFPGRENLELFPVKGQYDAEAKTITIKTPFTGKIGGATKLATYQRGGSIYTATLVACQLADRPDMTGQYPISTLDELVFEVGDNGELKAKGQWLIYTYSDNGNGIEDLYTSTDDYVTTEKAYYLAFPAEVRFPENDVYATIKAQQPLYVANIGRQSGVASFDVYGDGLQLAASPYVEALTLNQFMIYLTAKQEGEFNGSVTVKGTGDNQVKVPVWANVQKPIDYNVVVTKGDFSFSLPESDYFVYAPWVVNESITDHPVLYARCDELGECGLNITMTIPKGETGIFSWKGKNYGSQPNGFRVVIDDSEIAYNNMYDHSGYVALHDADGYVVVPEGKHVLTLEYMMMMDWYNQGYQDEQSYAYVWDLNLDTYKKEANVGRLMTDSLDFGLWNVDKVVSEAYAAAELINLGSAPLKVLGSVDSESFKVLPNVGSAVYLDKLPVNIAFRGTHPGEYDETVTIKTDAGDFDVRCVAKAQEIPVNYDFLVSEGDISFGTSINYPFAVNEPEKIAYSTLTDKDKQNVEDFNSWLSFSFEVADGDTGTISWEGYNSSEEYFSFMGDEVISSGTQVYIDGELAGEFVGECEMSSLDIDEELLTVGPGFHTVKFNYMRNSSTPEGEDRVVIKSICVKSNGSGVETIIDNEGVKTVEYYSLDGFRVVNPEKGIYLKCTVDAAGKATVVKVVK